MKKKTFLCLILTAAIFLSAFSTFRNEQGMDGANVVSSVTPEDTADCGAILDKQIFHKGNLIQLYSDYRNKRHLCRKFEYTL